MSFGLERVHVRGFRSARDVTLDAGALCALVGDANAGKSNLLAAIRAVLDPRSGPIRPTDPSAGGDGRVQIQAHANTGASFSVEVAPGTAARVSGGPRPAVLMLPAALRAGSLFAPVPDRAGSAAKATAALRAALTLAGEPHDSHAESAPAIALVDAISSLCETGLQGLVLLIEEPELYLRPQAQRYLYRRLRDLALAGNQVIYSTHAPAFLNVARMEELVLVDHHPQTGTRVRQPGPVSGGADFRALSEFDAERSELFLARAVILVEGLTEKLALPFIFKARGYDADRDAISVVECGGKGNLLIFIRICKAARVPFVVIHDRDTRGQRAINAQIQSEAGERHTIVLTPNFEAVTGLPRGRHKPEHAWRMFSERDAEIPEPLAHAVEVAVELARQ